MREIKFRGLSESGSGWKYGYLFLTRFTNTHQTGLIPVIQVINDTDDGYNGVKVNEQSLGQFTGLKDKNGKDIYEGDIIKFCKPIRTTQTHEGDNIPNGSYTEPMEPGIVHFQGEVKFENGCFVFDDYEKDGNLYPLEWNIVQWDEESIKDAISYGRPDRFIWDDVEEGDMQYLLEENNFTELQQLVDFLSGVEVISNIHENPELL